MLKKQTHITGFLSLLICVSLGFSTVHSHEQFEWSQNSQAPATDLPNSITTDTNLCPVDNYLYNADIAPPIATNIILVALERNSLSAFDIYHQPTLLNLNNRSPPVGV